MRSRDEQRGSREDVCAMSGEWSVRGGQSRLRAVLNAVREREREREGEEGRSVGELGRRVMRMVDRVVRCLEEGASGTEVRWAVAWMIEDVVRGGEEFLAGNIGGDEMADRLWAVLGGKWGDER